MDCFLLEIKEPIEFSCILKEPISAGECEPGLILIDGDLLLVPWDTGGDTGSGWEDGGFPVNGRDKDNTPGADLEFVESPAAEVEVGGNPDAGLDDVEALEGGRERGYNSGVVSNTWSCSSMVMTGILQPASRTGGSDTS